ncbi:hypothetical protein K6L05_00235 [Salinicoccus roseus]|uniref:hypothetical protein n=1 Tax=Salinicoccus roseus TaxID=45670 RepID=UPI001CA74926|nr:hypothetical protein [Salinicoccus roseus]MBY8908211.1 hypothetical protein [Salinicoccus roseus]
MTENKQNNVNQNNVVDLEFDDAYQDIGVKGEIFRLDLSDLALKKLSVRFRDTGIRLQELDTELNPDTATEEDIERIMDAIQSEMKQAIDKTFGEGEYDRLYKLAGGSTSNILKFINTCTNIIDDRREKQQKEAQQSKAQQHLKQKRRNAPKKTAGTKQ